MALLDRSIAYSILTLLLRPIARFCLKNSLRLTDLVTCMKAAFVAEAREYAKEKRRKCNTSSISLMTGVYRRDVVRISKETEEPDYSKDLIMKVIGLWQTGAKFRNASGAPRVLSVDGPDSEFAALVTAVSVDVHPAAVLAELERVGAIEQRRTGIALLTGSYAPKKDWKTGFDIVSRDYNDILSAAEENVLQNPEITNLHSRTEYDSVRAEGIDELRQWLLREGHSFHLKAREIISKYDQDVNPKRSYKGELFRVVLGTFGFTERSKE